MIIGCHGERWIDNIAGIARSTWMREANYKNGKNKKRPIPQQQKLCSDTYPQPLLQFFKKWVKAPSLRPRINPLNKNTSLLTVVVVET